jgi:Uma2 family endonuclease
MSIALTEAPFRGRVTREEYAALPEGPPYYELIAGKLVMSPSPAGPHVQFFLYVVEKLNPHVRYQLRGKLFGEFDLYLPGTDNVYRPDLVYVSRERLSSYRRNGIHGVPDLVGEIISPSTWRLDREVKLKAFERAGVPHVWIVQPETPLTVEEYVLTSSGRYELHATTQAPTLWTPVAFPGWSLDLDEAQVEIALPEETEPDTGRCDPPAD